MSILADCSYLDAPEKITRKLNGKMVKGMIHSIENTESTDLEKLKSKVNDALGVGTIVLIAGNYRTGKSFLIDKLFSPEKVLATKNEGLSCGVIEMKPLQKRLARTGNVAIDETEWLSDDQIDYVLDGAVAGNKGIVFATHSISRILEQINKYKKEKQCELSILTINLLSFDRELHVPVWRSN